MLDLQYDKATKEEIFQLKGLNKDTEEYWSAQASEVDDIDQLILLTVFLNILVSPYVGCHSLLLCGTSIVINPEKRQLAHDLLDKQ